MKKMSSFKSLVASSMMLGAVLTTSAEAATTLRIASQHAPDQYASEVLRQIKDELEGQVLI